MSDSRNDSSATCGRVAVIGYQGVKGSNSEKAATEMAAATGLKEIRLVPLVSSRRVINALENGEIEYGVIATKNSIGGEVKESMDSLKGTRLELISTIILPIHHCLFKRNASVDNASLTNVASHIQALKQTTQTIANRFPHIAHKIEIDDTARGADMLVRGELGLDTAVICSYEAGTERGLTLVARDIEDTKDNRTEFRLFKLSEPKYIEQKAMTDQIIDDSNILEWLGRGVLVVVLFASLWLMTSLKWSALDCALAISGYITALIVVWTKFRNKAENKSFVGFWKYYTIPFHRQESDQHYHVPRIVEITENGGKLQIKGYTPDPHTTRIVFGSDKVYVKNTDARHGIFVYEYDSDINALDLGGYVVMKWYKPHFFSSVKRMTGKYFGVRSREMGTLVYQRISKREFDNIRKCEFLH